MSILLRAAAAVGVSVSVMGCAIHPLPEDVTGVSTYKIVHKIRCEAREGIRKNVSTWLQRQREPAAQELGRNLQNHTQPFETFYSSLGGLPKDLKGKVVRFQKAAIAYDFTFNITELNNIDPSLNLTRIIKNKTFTDNSTANFDRMRQNTRTFTISDTFEKLAQIPEARCEEIAVEGENFFYPIAGRIGVDNMVRTFVGLEVSEDLTSSDQDPTGKLQSTKGPASLTDFLLFTTTLKASTTPQLTVMPLGTALRIASESVGVSASRTDVHSVIVALAMPPPPKADSNCTSSNSTTTTTGSTKTTTTFSDPNTKCHAKPTGVLQTRGMFIDYNFSGGKPEQSDAELAALHAIDLFILRFQLNNVSVAVSAP